ncbi:hypothetical protein NDU88_009549 [Pleurodeles waltl]|uniref:Uncharacterized protein n=1 Tax=Pleurodeles waltl TaxID=8319 RepID=A0AAV7RYQ4_PLEWA|nr:hypothetical protein NDU88_009549 [Pleurodeles waltl]
MKPAPNGAGGVVGVRRVQWHPSRFSVSAKQTLKIFMGPHDTRSRHPVGWQEGGRNPHGGAASRAAMEDSLGQG